jgi:hypothetical protein
MAVAERGYDAHAALAGTVEADDADADAAACNADDDGAVAEADHKGEWKTEEKLT